MWRTIFALGFLATGCFEDSGSMKRPLASIPGASNSASSNTPKYFETDPNSLAIIEEQLLARNLEEGRARDKCRKHC